MGMHPQTGERINKWDCAIVWMPMLTIENTQKANEVGAAIESFRNEMVRQGDIVLAINGEKPPEIEKPRS